MLERLKCPLHGNRFKPFGLHIFMAAWLIEKLPRLVDRRSEQFRKAWFATFPLSYGPRWWKKGARMGLSLLDLKKMALDCWPNLRCGEQNQIEQQ